jgi:hypothetical protein
MLKDGARKEGKERINKYLQNEKKSLSFFVEY